MRTLVVFAIALAFACSPSLRSGATPSDVRLRVEPATVSAGESVTLILVNGSAGAIGYNLCTSGLERQVGGAWQGVPSDRVCTMELRTLQPGQEVRYPLELSEGLAPGEYRYITNVERFESGERAVVRSDAFRVDP